MNRTRRGCPPHPAWLPVLVLAASACSPDIANGWRASPLPDADSRCYAHRGIVVRDEFESLRFFMPASLETVDWEAIEGGWVHVSRGEDGWWIANQGSYGLEFGQRGGNLGWLADDTTRPDRLADGRYVGVVEVDDGILAIHGECPKNVRHWVPNAMVLQHFTRTADGWSPPEERGRWVGMCPTHAIAHRGGMAIVVQPDALAEPQLLRLEGSTLSWQGSFPEEWRWALGPQLATSDEGELMFSWGIPRNSDPDDGPEPTHFVRWSEPGTLEAGVVVGGCVKPDPLPLLPAAPPERALGVMVDRRDGVVEITMLGWSPSLRAVVDYAHEIDGAIELALNGAAIERGEEGMLLELPPGAKLTWLLGSLDDAQIEALKARRADLFYAKAPDLEPPPELEPEPPTDG